MIKRGKMEEMERQAEEIKSKMERQLMLPGNAPDYDLSKVVEYPESFLKGKRILFLGSSVTYGAVGVSFVEYLVRKDGVVADKQAISGTTLVDEESVFARVGFGNGGSYVRRLKELVKTSNQYECFVCQLSTNDASSGKPMGVISQSRELEDFDTLTVIGAMEYIIAYVRKHWNCPIVFYTACFYENPIYEEMVRNLYVLRDKWGIKIIDLYTDKEFNGISDKERALYMMDEIHPTRAGYLNWWLPEFEKRLEEIMKTGR